MRTKLGAALFSCLAAGCGVKDAAGGAAPAAAPQGLAGTFAGLVTARSHSGECGKVALDALPPSSAVRVMKGAAGDGALHIVIDVPGKTYCDLEAQQGDPALAWIDHATSACTGSAAPAGTYLTQGNGGSLRPGKLQLQWETCLPPDPSGGGNPDPGCFVTDTWTLSQ